MSTGAEHPWSKTVSELEKSNMIDIIPYDVHLDYDYWDYRKSTVNIGLYITNIIKTKLPVLFYLKPKSMTKFHPALLSSVTLHI